MDPVRSLGQKKIINFFLQGDNEGITNNESLSEISYWTI